MAAAAKKTLTPSPPLSRAGALAARLQANHEAGEVYCATDIMKDWRYIDFFNPQQNQPCISLEWLFGARGLLAGRIMRLQAGYGKGKSSFMWLMYAAAQRLAKAYCYHIESEATPPPPDFISSFGCNPADLVIAHPRSLEACLEDIDEMLAEIRGGLGGSIDAKTGRTKKTIYVDPLDPNFEAPIIAGIDSFSALGIDSRVNQDILDQAQTASLAEHSRKISKYFQDRNIRFKQCQMLLMIAAQEKAVIKTGLGGRGGPDKSSIGDAPIGFHATYSVDLSAFTYRDAEGNDVGERVNMYTTKNKLSPKHRSLELYLIRDHGFDLVMTDFEFLSKHPASPFGEKELYKHSHGVSCKMLSEKSFASEQDFLKALYGDANLLASLREKMRIRGFNFEFEQKYVPTPEEIEDNAKSPKGESVLHGVEGSEKPVHDPVNAE